MRLLREVELVGLRVDEDGDPIRIDGDDLGTAAPRFGKISLVYPQIEEGRVVADAVVEGLEDYFVNERVRVWIAAGARPAYVIPARFITTRFGLDYVRVRTAGNVDVDVLSGLQNSDRLVRS